MADALQIDALKRTLRNSVSRFCSHDHRKWKQPILQTIDVIRESEWPSVLFGGTLRSLLAPRVVHSHSRRPRDIDIVVGTSSVDAIYDKFATSVHRRTRFGGLQIHRAEWQFDLWPLGQTWAFVEDARDKPSFEDLPATTFFNLEAVAVELWPGRGKAREIYSGDDQFFSGLIDRVLEINRSANPFPELCVARSIVIASGIGFRIGPRLAAYVASKGEGLSVRVLQDVQRKHYGMVRVTGESLKRWIGQIQERVALDAHSPVELPQYKQMSFWPKCG